MTELIVSVNADGDVVEFRFNVSPVVDRCVETGGGVSLAIGRHDGAQSVGWVTLSSWNPGL